MLCGGVKVAHKEPLSFGFFFKVFGANFEKLALVSHSNTDKAVHYCWLFTAQFATAPRLLKDLFDQRRLERLQRIISHERKNK